ncbi:hypothetical protein CEXT_703081 [Caerostris extrusa]|uniref:Uncharacterized protein n=1 Tax=Caerostris extrusa TaxID=172846 RepID=A0AAV4XWG4_CAEEX|nr:hypothetical protein CEXT_703081 [Caerostris extrusa]
MHKTFELLLVETGTSGPASHQKSYLDPSVSGPNNFKIARWNPFFLPWDSEAPFPKSLFNPILRGKEGFKKFDFFVFQNSPLYLGKDLPPHLVAPHPSLRKGIELL